MADQDSNFSDEDAAWRDLVARYDAPLTTEEPVPWPEREGEGVPHEGDGATREGEGATREGDGATRQSDGATREDDGATREGDGATREGDGATGVTVVPVPRLVRGPRDHTVADDDEEHFIPPPPPPLPKLDPLAKGAWLALFGGPGYLVVATAAGWTVPGFAAFCAVAAFVAGFAILVLRMHEPGPGGPDDGDDGAVV